VNSDEPIELSIHDVAAVAAALRDAAISIDSQARVPRPTSGGRLYSAKLSTYARHLEALAEMFEAPSAVVVHQKR
jgi:hypothetical protein